jgi:hypothetical protein
MTFDDVSAVLVTRGDVDMQAIIDSLPYGETVVWDNSTRPVNYGVFGRYMAIFEATKSVIYFQDDDCLVTCHEELLAAYEPGVVTGNAFDDPGRLHRYEGTTLLGWGSIFDREMPLSAFLKYGLHFPVHELWEENGNPHRGLGAEIIFPVLSRNKTITHGIQWLDQEGPVLERENRMWKQPGFYEATEFWLARGRRMRKELGL